MSSIILFVIFISIGCLSAVLGKEDIIPLTIPLEHDINIPRLGLGTAGMRQQTRNAVYRSLMSGITMIDTAQANEWYNEQSAGFGVSDYLSSSDAGQSSARDIVIVTKVHPRSFELSKMRHKIIESRNLLIHNQNVTSALDVVLLHSPTCWSGHCTPEEEEVSWKTGWKNLEILKQEGLVKNIGVSNFHIHILRELVESASEPVSVIQNWMDPFHQDMAVRAYCQEQGIAYMAYSSFGTQWTTKLRHNPVFFNPVLDDIAKKHGVSIAKVVLSWLLQEDVIAIPRSTKDDHLDDNASLLAKDADGMAIGWKVFLDDEDMEAIGQLQGILGSLHDDDSEL